MTAGTAGALEGGATARHLLGPARLGLSRRRAQKILECRHGVVGVVGWLAGHGGEKAVIGHVIGGGKARQNRVAVKTGRARRRVDGLQHLGRALVGSGIVAQRLGRGPLKNDAEINLRIEPEQGLGRPCLLGGVGIGGVDVVVERGQPLEWADPRPTAPAIGLSIGREARRDRGRIGLPVGRGVEATGGPARHLHLGGGFERRAIRERGSGPVFGRHTAGRVPRMCGGVGATMHEICTRIARERHQQAGIEIGVGGAFDHFARCRIDGGVTEGAGNPHPQMATIVEGADTEDER